VDFDLDFDRLDYTVGNAQFNNRAYAEHMLILLEIRKA
jgi:hypothetical protein